jgi:bifunctional UDP-N-acetylglucosamine pyrophosphorylase/glucosamine-1-phosphate N-acetyltransferase
VGALVADAVETAGVNDRVQLAAAHRAYNERLLRGWMRSGVTVSTRPPPGWTPEVELAQDVRAAPRACSCTGRTTVARGAEVGPDCTLVDTAVGERARVIRAHCTGAQVGPDAEVGPFAYLRPGAALGPGSKVGTYVEVKASQIGPGARCRTCRTWATPQSAQARTSAPGISWPNYDGIAKHRTVIGEQVRTGSDTVLVAPVTVGTGRTRRRVGHHRGRAAGCARHRPGPADQQGRLGGEAGGRVRPSAEAAERAGRDGEGVGP